MNSREIIKMKTNQIIQEAVDRFLIWELPTGFTPDGGITFCPLQSGLMPTGTCLFTADQAQAMFEYCFAEALSEKQKEDEWEPLPDKWFGDSLVERCEDMSPRGRLQVLFDGDGDVIVAVIPDPNATNQQALEFCTIGSGGGGSPHTRNALIALFKAMERDNAESNTGRRGKRGRGAANEATK